MQLQHKYKENKRFNSILWNETNSRTPQEKERNRGEKKKKNEKTEIRSSNIQTWHRKQHTQKKRLCLRRTWSSEQTSRCVDLRRLHSWVAFMHFSQFKYIWIGFVFFSPAEIISLSKMSSWWWCQCTCDGTEFSPEFQEKMNQFHSTSVDVRHRHRLENYSSRLTSQFHLPLFYASAMISSHHIEV